MKKMRFGIFLGLTMTFLIASPVMAANISTEDSEITEGFEILPDDIVFFAPDTISDDTADSADVVLTEIDSVNIETAASDVSEETEAGAAASLSVIECEDAEGDVEKITEEEPDAAKQVYGEYDIMVLDTPAPEVTDTEDMGTEVSNMAVIYSDGFHEDPDGTDWYYYKNGKIATGTTDIIQGTVTSV